MTKFFRIKGLRSLPRKIESRLRADIDAVGLGMAAGGAFLQKESMKICPVMIGNLRNSAFTRRHGKGEQTTIEVGYTAKYAVFVHENTKAAHGAEFNRKHRERIKRTKARGTPLGNKKGHSIYAATRGPKQQAKFLERPAREKRREIINIVLKVARKKIR